jgi:hypothetical protein
MNALHRGGFLFGANDKGAIAPVVINATVQQIIVSVIAFLFSRCNRAEDAAGLYDYILHTADRVCKMRLKDIPAKDGSSEGK